MKLVVLLLAFLTLNGCAVGNKIGYHDVDIEFDGKGTSKLAISTIDLRVYVRTSEKSPDFVGLQRGGFGNPFDVTTASGKSLAEDITATVKQALEKKGFEVTSLVASNTDSISKVVERMDTSDAHRLMIFILNEWKSDTYTNTALIYNLTLKIMDNEGKVITESTINGRDNLGGDFIDPPSHAKQAVPIAFKAKLEQLLNNKEVLDALM